MFGYKYLDLLQQTKISKMETTIKFSTDFLSQLDQVIFVTIFGEGWQTKWEILTDSAGKHFTDLDEAIDFVRLQNTGKHFTDLDEAIDFVRLQNRVFGIEKLKVVGLSTLKQAQRGNAMWDNL